MPPPKSIRKAAPSNSHSKPTKEKNIIGYLGVHNCSNPDCAMINMAPAEEQEWIKKLGNYRCTVVGMTKEGIAEFVE